MEKLAEFQLKPNNVTPAHAQLTVSCPSGENGLNVTRLVELEALSELEPSLLNHCSEELSAEPHLMFKLAIPTHAQLTVFSLNSPNGQNVTKLAELVRDQEAEQFQLAPLLVDLLALLLSK